MSFWDFVSANWWKIGGVAVGYVALTGRNPATMIPDLPVWWEMAAMAGVAAVVVGSMASGRIDSLLPDPPKVYVVEVNARNEPPIKVHKVTPDKWANTEVVHGSVLPVGPSPEQVYLCYEYNPRQDVAVGTWLESKNEAEFVGHHQASDALEAIGEVRDHLEPMARRGQRIRQYLPSIVRDLDRRRARAQNSALAGHTAPSIGSDEEDTIESVVESHVPEELRPERMTAGESQERNANSEGGEFVGLDLLDGEEALTPDSDALRNDGGSR